VPVEQITPPGLKVVEVAENGLVAGPDAIHEAVGDRWGVKPDVDGWVPIGVRESH
jgi:hypothetical protein